MADDALGLRLVPVDHDPFSQPPDFAGSMLRSIVPTRDFSAPNIKPDAIPGGLPQLPVDAFGSVPPMDEVSKDWAAGRQPWPGALLRGGVDLAKGAWAPVDYAGKVVSGQISPVDENGRPTQEAIAQGFNAMGLMAGGLKYSPEGSAGVFGGRLAKTADQATLAEAERMTAARASREEIFKQTGWYRDAGDGKWKFEIPDTEARVVGGQFYHPALSKAYPDLNGIRISADQSRKVGTGFYEAATSGVPERIVVGGPIEAGGNLSKEQISVILHELQHAIQKREGFAFGASPSYIATHIEDELTPLLSKFAPGSDEHNKVMKALDVLKLPDRSSGGIRYNSGNLNYQMYHRSPGEVEPRNVQARFNDPEKYNLPPWQTQDVPESKYFRMTPVDHDPFAGAP